jgi:hypothetical protein
LLKNSQKYRNGALDEKKIFRAVLWALIVTILICIVAWFNLMLLGDFFFVYFIAFLTSVSLRTLKRSIVETLETSINNPFYLVK